MGEPINHRGAGGRGRRAVWTKMGTRQPSTPAKFALGTLLMGVAFLLFLPVANGAPHTTPLLWLVFGPAGVHHRGAAHLPVGLSVTTKLAPAAFKTQMIALFYLSISPERPLPHAVAKFYDPSNEVPYFTTWPHRHRHWRVATSVGAAGSQAYEGRSLASENRRRP